MKKSLPINGHSIYVESYGPNDGPPLVLLHHGLGAIKSWEEQIPALADYGFRVIAYDRWGYGKSGSRPGFAMPEFAPDLADLETILETLGVECPVLIGHSDGGTLALHFAVRYPARVLALVLIAAHIYVEEKMIAGIEETRQAYTEKPRFRRGMRRVHGRKGEQVFWDWYNGWSRPANRNWDIRPLLPAIACPVLVVQGLEDEHKTPQHARDLASGLPDAELWLVPNATHMLPQDYAEEFNARILQFLKNDELRYLPLELR